MGTFLSVPRGLLCAYGGRLDDANEIVASSRHNHRAPNVMHWRNPEHRELFLSGLRLAAGVTTSQTRQAGAATLVITLGPTCGEDGADRRAHWAAVCANKDFVNGFAAKFGPLLMTQEVKLFQAVP
jgi:hypothetical protein